MHLLWLLLLLFIFLSPLSVSQPKNRCLSVCIPIISTIPSFWKLCHHESESQTPVFATTTLLIKSLHHKQTHIHKVVKEKRKRRVSLQFSLVSDPPKTLHEWMITSSSLLLPKVHKNNSLFFFLSFYHGFPSFSHFHVPNPWRSWPPPAPSAFNFNLSQRFPLFPTSSLSRSEHTHTLIIFLSSSVIPSQFMYIFILF